MNKKLALHWQIMIGLVAGLIWAIASTYLGGSEFTKMWIKPFGDIFIRLLKLLAVPLVLFSIINGIAGLSDTTRVGRLGLKTLGFYFLTTLFAVSIGLGLVNTIQPGKKLSDANKFALQEQVSSFQNQESVDAKIAAKKTDAENLKGDGPLRFFVDLVPENIFFSLANNLFMLQVIVFAILFGLGITMIDAKKAAPVIQFMEGANDVIIALIHLVMRGAPFFVFALLAGTMAKIAGDNPDLLFDIFKGLAWFAVTALIGLLFLIFAVYPTLVALITGKINYREFLKGINQAQLVAFSTSSSAATLPVTMDCVRDRLGVSKEITGFVLPVGATVNMDGTSLYQAVSVVFLAQFFGHDLTMAEQLTIVLTATLASIGAPAVPSAGLVMMILVLESVDLPVEWIALIFPIDRPLDMVRTAVNVTGDAAAASVIAHSEGELHYPPKQSETI